MLSSLWNGRIEYTLRHYKNLILQEIGLSNISTITLVLTDRCNLKCRMCDIWEKDSSEKKSLELDKIERLLSLQCLKNTRHINFTGGEPFLREDLFEIYSLVSSLYSRCNITISSNGTLTREIVYFFSRLKQLKRITLELSLLGIRSHGHITNTEGSFKKFKYSIGELRRKFPSLKVQIKFTITPWNYSEIEETADYCYKNNLPFILKMIENIKSYTNNLRYEENIKNKNFIFSEEQLNTILDSLNNIKSTSLINKYVIEYLKDFIKTGNLSKRCFVLTKSLFINSNGDIYRCRMVKPIGNVRDIDLNSIITPSSNLIERLRRNMDSCKNCISIFRVLI